MAEALDLLLKIVCDRLFPERTQGTGPGAFANSRLEEICRAVSSLSELYTRDRAMLPKNLLQHPDRRLAYLAYFLPANFLKIRAVLNELWWHPQVKGLLPERLRILDLGCGPGTQLLGSIGFFAQLRFPNRIECVGVDSLESNLRDAQHLFDRLAAELSACGDEARPAEQHVGLRNGLASADGQGSVPRWTLQTFQADVSLLLKLKCTDPFDFIVMGNVLNELFSGDPQRVEQRSRRIASLVDDWLAPNGFVILIEPALRVLSRELLLVRDRLLDMLPLTVYSPCVHSLPCPAVGPGCVSDWCHEEQSWQAPSWIRQIDDRIGLRKNSLKYSYVVLTRTGLSVRDAGPEAASPS
jgi:ribosomal protein RSM22 (predicted rRNA methylase)